MTTMKMIAILALTLVSTALPALAEEQWCKPGQGTPKSEVELVAMLRNEGYEVRGTCKEHGCFEAKAVGPDGKRAEVYVDPTDGRIVRVKK